jgi:hypothetical protein
MINKIFFEEREDKKDASSKYNVIININIIINIDLTAVAVNELTFSKPIFANIVASTANVASNIAYMY